ncbi:Possible nucleotidyltransferase [hydrothermal vent metagenome]|uniref:Possible nucleotidyltransferase n=1 Tax=hydrothermal vent metagenome TaxID=652676 RepID=A0A1W1D3P3_9ZZZZ
MDIKLEIENVIEKNGTDFELSKLFKIYIKEYKDSLFELFEQSQGKDFLVKHTKKLDSILTLMYQTVLRRVFGNYLPMRNSIPIALFALGSFGREQLCVHSDIDILIVYKDIEGFNTKLIIEKLFYLALDAGLKLGHRVHEVSDLFQASNEDITIKTSLLEARFITGSLFLSHNVSQQLNKIRLYNQKEFLLAKLEESKKRRKKYPQSMEPNIKEGVGSLRDSNLLFWVAHTIYGVKNLKELTSIMFSEEEYKEYRIAVELLFRVRSALHLIANKQEDRLRLEYMPQMKDMLGFKDEVKLVSKVLEAQWQVNNFSQIFVKKMIRPYLFQAQCITQLRHHRILKRFYLIDNTLYASYKQKPLHINRLLELLLSLEDKPYTFNSSFLYQMTYAKITHPLSEKTYMLLKRLLKRKYTYEILTLFYDAGILHHLFVNFRKVLHLPQFDGYHTYPVDIHSLKAIQALENIKDPFLKQLHNSLSVDEKLLLKTVTLFHDTGKGRKQDHSEVGAKLIAPFLHHLHLSQELIERGVILVKHHILMSNVAFKENIYNEKTLYKFMSNIKDSTNLTMLYLLTYADIHGVSDTTYNSFNAKLLLDLYNNALEVAQNSDRITDAKKRVIIEKRLKNNPSFQALRPLLQKKTLRIESNLFFFKHNIEDIIQIVQQAQKVNDFSFTIHYEKMLIIEIYRKIPLNIGYLLASLSHLDVGSMEIFTLFDEIKYFKIEFKKNIIPEELPEVEHIIKDAFDMSKTIKTHDIIIDKKEIQIDCEHSKTHAEISVNTKNQIGLLAYIMDCFEQLHINVVTAKIHSHKHKVRDSFLIEKKQNICDNIANIYKLLVKGS